LRIVVTPLSRPDFTASSAPFQAGGAYPAGRCSRQGIVESEGASGFPENPAGAAVIALSGDIDRYKDTRKGTRKTLPAVHHDVYSKRIHFRY
jgi:hypothetical protein